MLIIGFGDIGKRLAARLLSPAGAGRWRIFALVRSADAAAEARQLGVEPLVGDLGDLASLKRLAGIAHLVVHLAPPPGEGARDGHTRHLVAALSRTARRPTRRMLGPQRCIYISTTGVYGDCAGRWIDETAPARPTTARASRRVDAETVLRAWGKRAGVTVPILRVPGIYAAERLPTERLKRGLPALCAEDDVYTNHIHAEDLVSAIKSAMTRGRAQRVVNVVDESAITMSEWFDGVADWAGLPRPRRVTRVEARSLLGPMLLSFMSESRRIRSGRVQSELGVVLRFPTVFDFLATRATEQND